jgi:nicotinamide mononucleotide transporter
MAEYVANNWMDILGTLLGLMYLYLEIKENVWMWIVGCIMPMIYIVVLYDRGIYADCAMEVYYFLAGIYGFAYWLRGKNRSGKAVSITVTPRKTAVCLTVCSIALWQVLGVALDKLTDSTVPYTDALTTSLSVIALWMLSRKLIEQWWVWFVVDLISSGLYIYKGIYGRALLYGIYTVMAVYGFLTWKRKMRQA